jgi:glycosyltransferase involved in cell wall biosynthesis
MKQPVVSIITPSFNRADVIRETADSILSQTYPHWEWMVVDDGSTDGSREVLQSLAQQDGRIRLSYRDREPKGACTCRNIAVENCTGDYLIFLDTDDLLAPYCLEQRVAAMLASPDRDFIIFPMLMFRFRKDDMNVLWNIDSQQDDMERILFGDAICQGTGTLWKRESFQKAGMWDERLLLWQDVELHLRSLLSGCIYGKRMDLPPDVYLRVSYVSISRTGFHSAAKLESRIRVMRQTVWQVLAMGLRERYLEGIRHMFTDIYLGAANSRRLDTARSLMHMEEEWNLLSPRERRWFRRYLLMQQLRLYRLPWLKQHLVGRLRRFVPTRQSNIGVIPYA